MTTARFKEFKNYVAEADNNDPIWWAGYEWINLTEKQGKQMADLLVEKGMGRFDADGNHYAEMPSGLRLIM